METIKRILSIPRNVAVGIVVIYRRFLSPLKPKCCRFAPTCSEYAIQALVTHGLIKGLILTIWRILRCHPFYHGRYYDPVPPKGKWRPEE